MHPNLVSFDTDARSTARGGQPPQQPLRVRSPVLLRVRSPVCFRRNAVDHRNGCGEGKRREVESGVNNNREEEEDYTLVEEEERRVEEEQQQSTRS